MYYDAHFTLGSGEKVRGCVYLEGGGGGWARVCENVMDRKMWPTMGSWN